MYVCMLESGVQCCRGGSKAEAGGPRSRVANGVTHILVWNNGMLFMFQLLLTRRTSRRWVLQFLECVRILSMCGSLINVFLGPVVGTISLGFLWTLYLSLAGESRFGFWFLDHCPNKVFLYIYHTTCNWRGIPLHNGKHITVNISLVHGKTCSSSESVIEL